MTPHPNANAARRAIGAMFIVAFGGAWLGLWGFSVFTPAVAILAGIAVATAAFFLSAWRVYRFNAQALSALSGSSEEKRRSMIFNYINAGQWVLIFVLANVLNHCGRTRFILPMIIFVVGAHFLPLARLFSNAAHVLTGMALMLWSVAYSAWPGVGPRSATGALGAGVILWLSAGWALRPRYWRQNGA